MTRLILLLALGGGADQQPPPGTTAVPGAAAQRPERNPTVVRAFEVLDSLVRAPQPRLSAADARAWTQQKAWFTDLRARIQNLLAMVVAPAKVPTPAPVDEKNVEALQKEAETESEKFATLVGQLKTRHDVAMNAIRNMKA
jgi:hypothetical protein